MSIEIQKCNSEVSSLMSPWFVSILGLVSRAKDCTLNTLNGELINMRLKRGVWSTFTPVKPMYTVKDNYIKSLIQLQHSGV